MPISDPAAFSRVVLEANDPVLVEFSSTWCPPCRVLEQALRELGSEFPSLPVEHVDVDQATELAARYGVRSVPTLLAFHRGQVTAAQVGFPGKHRLRAFLSMAVERGGAAAGLQSSGRMTA